MGLSLTNEITPAIESQKARTPIPQIRAFLTPCAYAVVVIRADMC
jgi:hypothetical protein